MAELKYKELIEKIIGAAMKVHAALGSGFQEVIYQRAMEIELTKTSVNIHREFEMPVYYTGIKVGERRVDFLVEDKISVELKAISQLENQQLTQAKNYLEAYNLEIRLLINFGSNSLEFKRLYNSKYKDPILNQVNHKDSCHTNSMLNKGTSGHFLQNP